MRSIPVLATLLAVILAACGGGGARLETAEVAYRAGNLDRALALIEGDATRAAADLRTRIAERRAARIEVEERVAAIEAEPDPAVALAALGELARTLADPFAREAIARAQSRTHDRRASQGAVRRTGAAASQDPRPAPPVRPAAPVPASADDLLRALRAEVEASIEARDWSRGIALVQLALDDGGSLGTEALALRRELRGLAAADLEDLLHAAVRVEAERGLAAAHVHLAREAHRFASSGHHAALERELRDLEGRIAVVRMAERTGAPASAPATPRPSARADVAAADTEAAPAWEAAAAEKAAQAAQAEEADELELAAELWLQVAMALPPGLARDGAVARSREFERRQILRAELLAAHARDAVGFAALGIDEVDTGRLVVGGERREWSALDLGLLKRAAARARLSQEAELGLVIERVVRGDLEGPDGALVELHRLAERGRLSDVEAWQLVARARGEELPAGGYVHSGGRWLARSHYESAERAALVVRLEERLLRAGPQDRNAACEALVELGAEAEAALERALEGRWRDASQKLRRGATLAQLERVAEQRRELDRRRSVALELIFDEERYFYPYNPPAVDPRKAGEYWPVQREVDTLVAAVRELWDDPRVARPPTAFRDALAELAWTGERAHALALRLPAGDELPDWLAGIDAELPEIGLAQFAWTARELADLRYDRAVRARNENLWAVRDRQAEQLADQAEREQLRITNDYRQLLGRRALAWNPLIQEAARMHSRYMADTGDFGHFQPDPERRAPGDRMRLVGYPFGMGENCHRGSGGPRGAHEGWIRSSGHHRNILNPAHREMASAGVSSYWTQNFGVGTAFLAELELDSPAR